MPLVRRDPPNRPEPDVPGDPFAALSGVPVETRAAAARAMAGRAHATDALGAALTAEQDGRVREAIVMALLRTGGSAAVQALLPALRSDDAALRSSALDALSAMPADTAPLLATLLADADADVRLLSCEIARRLPPDEATRLLCDLLDREPDANVCAAAVEVLAEAGDASAETALRRCLGRFPDAPFLQFSLRTAIARLAAARG